MMLHLDMDAFFASVEQLDNPELRGKCVVVGGGSERGVVTTASYEARVYGVRSAMPMFMARRKCPHAVVVPPRMDRYKEISRQVMSLLMEFSPVIEKVSIDEAYMDLSGRDRIAGSLEAAARGIKDRIRKNVGLTCSIGIAPLKFLAKIASDMQKPDGLTVITPQAMPEILKSLPVGRIPGVGKVAGERLARLGIYRLGDVADYPEAKLCAALGRFGYRLKELSLGVDRSKITPHQLPKSISSEQTLARDTDDRSFLRGILLQQSEEVGSALRRHQFMARTVVLKIKHADFRQATRSTTLNNGSQSDEIIYQSACKLLDRYPLSQKVRLIGVGGSNLVPAGTPVQLPLFEERCGGDAREWERLDHAVDRIRSRFGDQSIRKAAAIQNE
ncbi:MAG: DNA polymerase IV [Desulfobacterales bacterium]